ncbi:MAG: hypothetical protein GY841_10330 [FCB group bacterium]|nr:hypothetical protein [FCB group bacterium]
MSDTVRSKNSASYTRVWPGVNLWARRTTCYDTGALTFFVGGTGTEPPSGNTPIVRQDVRESLEKSMRENAAVWRELAQS